MHHRSMVTRFGLVLRSRRAATSGNGTWERKRMVRGIFVTALCLACSVAGCGSDDDGDASNSGGGGGSGGSSGSGGSGGTSGSAPNCDGAFARVPVPYTPNTTVAAFGAFAVDERGAVFTAIPDEMLMEDTSAYNPVIMASDLDGNVTTLLTSDGADIFSDLILRGDAVYMITDILFPGIKRMARSGGTPVEIVEGTVSAGPILHDDFIYYAKAPGSDPGIYRLEPDTDTSTLLTAREDLIITLDRDGDTLYWIESDGVLEETDYRLFGMPAEGGTVEMLQELPRAEIAIPSFRVIDGVLFGSDITEGFDFIVTRTPIGEAPVTVEDNGGMPIAYGDGFAYYGSVSGGMIKAPLSFASKSTVAGTEDRAMYSIAVGPDDLWYSELSCIFRTAK
jgi:hypothetical protein